MVLVVEIDNVETTSVNVEVNIPFLKIWRHRFPHFGERKRVFNRMPGFKAQAFALLARRDEKEPDYP